MYVSIQDDSAKEIVRVQAKDVGVIFLEKSKVLTNFIGEWSSMGSLYWSSSIHISYDILAV